MDGNRIRPCYAPIFYRKLTWVLPPVAKNGKEKLVPKFFRDIIAYMADGDTLVPSARSPICQKCKLHQCGARTPFMQFVGSDDPLITFVFDAPSKKEDLAGMATSDGPAKFMLKVVEQVGTGLNINLDRLRFAMTTRCAVVQGKGNPATGGRWCRHHLVEDLWRHPPKLIVPVGSVALGLLSHKSNAQDWGGRLLTWRGWPDDWLVDRKFESGHPIFGPRPDHRVAMLPLQKPGLIYATRNPHAISRWQQQVRSALELALAGAPPKTYDKPWWRFTENPDEVVEVLDRLIQHPGTVVTYDTETTGLRPWLGQKIVTMMVRFDDPVTGQPVALGWPWDYNNLELKTKLSADGSELADQLAPSPMLPHLGRLAPYVLKALASSKLRGHNLTFDLMFTIASVPGGAAYLNQLSEAFHEDTWHMRYVLRQERGSIGLELVAYDWAPDLAGYEEDMTLMIDRYEEVMHPRHGGHYGNCPKQYWQTHFRPYLMGDVEVCHTAAGKLAEKMQVARRFDIPLAHHLVRGKFRKFSPPSREFVYRKIISPAAGMLSKIMARGMYVDAAELTTLETLYPKMIFEARDKLRVSNPALKAWCEAQEASDPTWEFDLQSADVLKSALFEVMDLPVTTLTDAGDRVYKSLDGVPRAELIKYASTDKFTLNGLAVNHAEVRSLLEYRTLHKAYTSYVRPMRNITTPGLDRNKRKDLQLLSLDSCVHPIFGLTGTRSGRLSCQNPNLQQVPRDGLIKTMYSSRFGRQLGCLYQGDLSQIELRLLACACGDPTMVKAYVEGIDLHSLTTHNVFKIPMEHFSEDHEMFLQRNGRGKEVKELKGKRKIGKTLNFLTGYGGGAFGFQSALALQGVYLQLEECERHLESFFETYPYLRTHIGMYKTFVQNAGLAVSITGRVRILEEVFSEDPQQSNKALRAAYNHLIQSSASDCMLVCLIAIEALMREANLQSMLVSTVHDSLVVDCLRAELPKVHEIVNWVLQNIPTVLKLVMGDDYDISWLLVPLSGDCGVGVDYLHEVKLPKHNNIDWDEINRTMEQQLAE